MEDEIQLVELLHQINRNIWKLLSDMFRKERLSTTEIIVLVTMSKKKTSRVTDLAAMIGIPCSTLTGILDRLVLQGFLERSPDPDDRRSVLMSATAKLDTIIADRISPMKDTLRMAFKSMPKPRIKRLLQDLRFVVESLERKD
jgi:DNA-binding MarR family transcriptional regulator